MPNMSVEMSKCNRGDKLRTHCGDMAEYVKRSGDDLECYPHVVRNLDTGRAYTVCENSYFWRHPEDQPHEGDIVEILEVKG